MDQIRHLYDFQSHYLDRNGHKYHYLDEGRGEPVVMIHGNPSWSFMYRELVVSLRGSYRVIVPDHVGCGLSDKPRSADYEYRLAQRVSDFESLLAQLGVTRHITLIMHDWGGPIGMTYATHHPSSIGRLIILNTAAFLLPPGKTLPWSLRFCRDSRVAAFLIRRFNAFSVAATYVGCRLRPMSAEVRRAYTGPYDSWKNRIATLRFVQDIPLTPGDPSYALLRKTQEGLYQFQKTPMLICWGEQDFVFDHNFLEEWVRRFPKAEIHRFSQAGHYVLEEVPAAIVSLVGEFLANHPLKQGAQ